ncbi:hypothetical protein GLOIN_2v1609921 [Rhizophagus irregularis DAOM 181602=DAOM 197198]|jgi:hypothetical protein|uniref:Uncharacterized protein n=1 Tax=Rhizophagus irregularis (strain DAOM 181602 / DAOM 197198 / MUCL 43194) TaxID=747089 RepID=A0A2P4Q0F0_RHIID|nr:hypothetical protein GLOIN_2v1609921 [Rhizophagus irregularis DAOM 181602=DAOM 197198]POG71092.1 hypothetical protein GLOIN_2v1609921 [Rhizophagus irregularis DAOM 181602=DAOM 197198]|eukprot:XP_025177958.1 hypothetical protein GLOIN_2v1609921 [Rhizophagus irregularis DAOM 181602=DAOM 197198]
MMKEIHLMVIVIEYYLFYLVIGFVRFVIKMMVIGYLFYLGTHFVGIFYLETDFVRETKTESYIFYLGTYFVI